MDGARMDGVRGATSDHGNGKFIPSRSGCHAVSTPYTHIRMNAVVFQVRPGGLLEIKFTRGGGALLDAHNVAVLGHDVTVRLIFDGGVNAAHLALGVSRREERARVALARQVAIGAALGEEGALHGRHTVEGRRKVSGRSGAESQGGARRGVADSCLELQPTRRRW